MARILLVEDDADSREAVRDILEDAGHTVATAQNGREGLSWLEQQPAPDLILLDLMMPVMNGWQLMSELSRNDRLHPIPVVLLSASGDLATKARELGAVGYLRKPLDLDDLLAAVQRHALAGG